MSANFSLKKNENFIYLAAEGASIFTVLGDFHFFHHLPEGSTITGPIFTGDSNLLGTLSLKKYLINNKNNF